MPLFVSVERDYYFRCFRWFSLWILLWEVKFFEFSMRYNVSRWFFVTFYCILIHCRFSLILTFWYNLFNCYCEAFVTRVTIRGGSRGGSRAAATSKMECFVIIVNGLKPLTIITKHSSLDIAAALDPLLVESSISRQKRILNKHFCKNFFEKSLMLVFLWRFEYGRRTLNSDNEHRWRQVSVYKLLEYYSSNIDIQNF